MNNKVQYAMQKKRTTRICSTWISYLQNQVLKLQQSIQQWDKNMAKVRFSLKLLVVLKKGSIHTFTQTLITKTQNVHAHCNKHTALLYTRVCGFHYEHS